MTEDLNKVEELLKRMPKEEKDSKLLRVLKQEEKAKERSRNTAQIKKQAGIKQLSIDLQEPDLIKFKSLMQAMRYNKTELIQYMMQLCERSIQQQQQSQQHSQHNQQQNQHRR